MKNISFKNWTSKDFAYKFGGQLYIFQAGKTYSVPSEIAQHFAHHLALRELNSSIDERDHMLADDKVRKLKANCFPGVSLEEIESVNPVMSFEIVDEPIDEKPGQSENQLEATNQNATAVADESVGDNRIAKKMGRPKKTVDQEYTK